MVSRRDILKASALAALLGAVGCSNEQPRIGTPVTYTGVPRDVVEVKGRWKMGPYTQGFRVEFDDYFAISDGMGLYGQEGMAFAGPGLVKHATVESFRKIADLCERIKGAEPVTIHGDLAKTRDGKEFRYNGKKVLLLFEASYNGQKYEVNRRPWDN